MQLAYNYISLRALRSLKHPGHDQQRIGSHKRGLTALPTIDKHYVDSKNWTLFYDKIWQ